MTDRNTFPWHSLFAVLLVIVAVGFMQLATAETVGAPVLSGTIVGWDRGEARLAAVSFTEEAPMGTIAETTIAEDGSFELALPTEVPTELLTPIDATMICPEAPEGLTLSPERFMGAGVFALGVFQGEALVGFIAHASSEAVALEQEGSAQVGDYAVFYVYAAEPITIQGDCVREAETEDVNLDLQAGWNTLISSATEVTEGVMSAAETRVSEVPQGAAWYFVEFPEGEAGGEGQTGGEGETGGEGQTGGEGETGGGG